MNKYGFLMLAGLISASSLHGMEGDELFEPSEWRSRKLKYLLEESKRPTCNNFNREIHELKRAFVLKYLEKYDDQQRILSDLLRETKGAIRATADPELAQKDSNKFLCIDPMQYSADEIDARWKRIHHADCKYSGPRMADALGEKTTDWQAIGANSGGIASVSLTRDGR